MKLNCDMGESFGRYVLGNDLAVMPSIHMANIACGFHAGDPNIIEETVLAAVKHGVEIGAHPSYPDLQGFGRRNMDVLSDDVRRMILYQVGALDAFCRVAGTSLSYVKPHGALYNSMMIDNQLLSGALQAVVDYNPELKLMVQATPRWQKHQALASEYGVSLLWEAFADRAYEDDGSLRNRRLPGAVLSEEEILKRVTTLCQTGSIVTFSGTELRFPIDVLCVHGDTESGVQISMIRELLDKYNVE